jgi:hypothetical protein
VAEGVVEVEEPVGGRMGPIPPLLVSELCDASHFLTTIGTAANVSDARWYSREGGALTHDNDDENRDSDSDENSHLHVLPVHIHTRQYPSHSSLGPQDERTTTGRDE